MAERDRTKSSRSESDVPDRGSGGGGTRVAKASDLASRVFVAELVLARVELLRHNLPYLHDPKDIEHVHQVRVACRRLRTAFGVFSRVLPPKATKRWSKRIRQLLRGLGAARDLDVHLEFLDRHLARVDDKRMRPGLERLRLRLAQGRRQAQRRLRRKLAKFARSGIVDDLDHAMRAVLVEGRMGTASSEPRCLWREAEEQITHLIGELLLHEPSVTKPERVEDHHAMRIAAKHLRYALEAFAPLYDGALQPSTVVARQLQRVLGDLHDCDVWIALLPEFLAEERKRTKRFYGHARGFGRVAAGMEALLADRVAAREGIHAAFVELWQLECGDAVWDELRQALRRTLQQQGRADQEAIEEPNRETSVHDDVDGRSTAEDASGRRP